jgi:hypothetical protein
VILLTWPFYGILAIFEEVARQAEEALYDEAALCSELRLLHARFEAGDMTEEEFTGREDELAARLARAEEYHRLKHQAAS